MTITEQPTTGVLYAAFLPIIYRVQELSVATTTVSAALQVTVLIDGAEKEILFYDSISTTPTSIGGNLDCFFKLDMSEAAQKWLIDMEALFLTARSINASWSFYNGKIDLRIKILPYVPNYEGLLNSYPLNEGFSDTISVFGAYLTEAQTPQYLLTYTLNTPRKFLTHKPLRSEVALEDSEFLFFCCEDGLVPLSIRVTFFDNTGQIGNGVLETFLQGSETFLLVGAGALNIAEAQWTTFSGDVDVANCTYYEIALFDDSTTPISETRRYTITHNCKGYRLHFLNQFGVFDSIFLNTDIKETSATKGELFDKLRGLAVSSRSQLKLSTSRQISYDGIVGNLNDAEVQWVNELLLSPSVFLEKDGLLLPVILEDISNVTKETAQLNEMKVSFYCSNKTFSQKM